jgi:hypothetical protein
LLEKVQQDTTIERCGLVIVGNAIQNAAKNRFLEIWILL